MARGECFVMWKACLFAAPAIALLAAACGRGDGHESRGPGAQTSSAAPQELSEWPADFSSYLGKSVRIWGTAADAKLGAMVLGPDGQSIWIDGMDSWPAGYYQGGDKGKRVCVEGKVIERKDLPVFIPKPGEPEMQGMPMPEGTDLNKASRRFLIADHVLCS